MNASVKVEGRSDLDLPFVMILQSNQCRVLRRWLSEIGVEGGVATTPPLL